MASSDIEVLEGRKNYATWKRDVELVAKMKGWSGLLDGTELMQDDSEATASRASFRETPSAQNLQLMRTAEHNILLRETRIDELKVFLFNSLSASIQQTISFNCGVNALFADLAVLYNSSSKLVDEIWREFLRVKASEFSTVTEWCKYLIIQQQLLLKMDAKPSEQISDILLVHKMATGVKVDTQDAIMTWVRRQDHIDAMELNSLVERIGHHKLLRSEEVHRGLFSS